MFERSRERSFIVWVGLAALLLAAGTASCKRKSFEEERVNFKQRTPIAKDQRGTDKLRFALAAMISPRETNKEYARLIQELGRELGRKISLLHGRSYKQVNRLLQADKLDMAFVCTGGYMQLRQMEPRVSVVAVPVVRGKVTYRSLVIVRQESTAKSFADLRGKRFAFTDPLSNTGYLYPVSLVHKQGATKDDFFASYVFVGAHDRAIRAVQRRAQDAAAVDSLVFEHLRATRPEAVAGLRVLIQSPEFGIPPIVAGPGATKAQRARWRQSLLLLHQRAPAKVALDKLSIDYFAVPSKGLYESADQLWNDTTKRAR